MNLKKLTSICCLTILGFSHPTTAQPVMPFSRHVETGSRTVFCMMKDADGIIWTGTSLGLLNSAQLVGKNGYTRYPQLNNVIKDIQQDNLQRLWVKTQSNAYLIYTPRTNQLIPDARSYLQSKGVDVRGDIRVCIDPQGKVWVYAGQTVWIYDCKSRFYQKLLLPKSTGAIVCIKGDERGMVIATQGAIYLSPFAVGRIQPRFYAKSAGWMKREKKLLDRGPDGVIWLYSDLKLQSLSPITKKWTWHENVQPDVTCMLRPNQEQYLIVGTTNAGLYVFGNQEKQEQHIYQTLPLKDGLANNHIESLFYDEQQKTLAVGYHKHNLSLFSMMPQQFRNHFVQSQSNMFLLEDVISFGGYDGHSVWMGTKDNGIYRVKTDGSDEILENRYPKTTATTLFKDSQGRLWTGLYHQGLVCSDGRSYFPHLSPYNIKEISPSRLFVLLNGEGLWALNPQTGAKQQIPMENLWLMDMAQVGHCIYTATPNYLYIIDGNTLRVRKIPASAFRHSNFKDGNKAMIGDSRGWIWLVNYKGHSPVDIYDTKTGKTFQCEPMKDYEIYALVEDVHGHIWFATDKGLVFVKVGKDRQFEVFCFEKRSNTLYNFRAMRSIGNMFVLGNTQGFHLVDPCALEKSLTRREASERLVPSYLRINETLIAPGQELDGKVLVDCDLPYLKHLDLAYDQNNIMLSCYPKTLEENEGGTYFYQLQGLDDEWMPIEGANIVLSNLPPGSYRLMVKEVNVNQQDLGEYELMSMTIHPPFWASIWAYLLYLAMAGAVGVLIYQYYHNRMKYRKQINEMMVKAEIEAGITPTQVKPVTLDEKLIADAVRVVEENMSDANFSVEELSEKLNMYRTNLYKKLQFLTGKTPTQFIRLMRLKRGKQLLSRGNVLISQVAYEVGFNDPKKFARYFKEEFGMLPSEYCKQQEEKK